MAKGKIVEWIEKYFGSSWKSTLYGIIGGVSLIAPVLFPSLAEGGLSQVVAGIATMLGFGAVRDNNVNDNQAGCSTAEH